MQIKLDMSITGSAKSWKGYEKQAAAGGGTVHPSAREDTGVSDQVKPNPIQIIWHRHKTMQVMLSETDYRASFNCASKVMLRSK